VFTALCIITESALNQGTWCVWQYARQSAVCGRTRALFYDAGRC